MSNSTNEDTRYELVSMAELSLRFNDQGLIPAIVQDASTGKVLMFAWMNQDSLALTYETQTAWFWSRSRQELWNKGATSGNKQQVVRILVDCDEDCLLVEVIPEGPACHTGKESCFYRELIS